MPSPYRSEDLFRYNVLGTLAGGTGHGRVAVSVRRALGDGKRYDAGLWAVQPGGDDAPRRLTAPGFSATYALFDAEGRRLAFLSKRDGTRQVQLLDLDGGEAQPVGEAGDATPASILDWSRNGRRLLLLASVPWVEDGEDDLPGDGAKPHVVRFLPYKQDGAGITVGARVHLHALDLQTGTLQALTRGDFDAESGAWSPDGGRLAIVRHADGRARHRSQLWLADAGGRGARLVSDALASIGAIGWSPDGARIALVGATREGDSVRNLWLADPDSGRLQLLGGEALELSPSTTLHWDDAGHRIALLVERRGLESIAVIDAGSGGAAHIPTPMRAVTALARSGDRLCFVAASMRHPEEVYSCTWDGADMRRHSGFNRWCRRRVRPRVSRRRCRVPDGAGGGERIDAWLLRPATGDPPYPLLVDLHGGPHSIARIDFAMHTYWYLLLARGWAVLAPNPVGSTSYGRGFADRLRGRWGELDLPQVEALVRRLQDEGVADGRVACAGKSYGGFLAAWAAAHSDLFRAAVAAAPVANLESHLGTSDTGYYVDPFAMDGDLLQVRGRYHRLSPMAWCAQVRAAMLILQGEDDDRCPRGQSEELFAQMVRCSDAPVELVMYPGSSHSEAESGKPSNRLDYHRRIVRWLSRHVGDAS